MKRQRRRRENDGESDGGDCAEENPQSLNQDPEGRRTTNMVVMCREWWVVVLCMHVMCVERSERKKWREMRSERKKWRERLPVFYSSEIPTR